MPGDVSRREPPKDVPALAGKRGSLFDGKERVKRKREKKRASLSERKRSETDGTHLLD